MRLKPPKLSILSAYVYFLTTSITQVSSQSSLNCTAETQTANSQSDLDALSECVTLSGSLTIGRDIVNATINGIQTIRGAFRILYGAKVERLEAPDLSFIGGIMQINGALNLTDMRMPNLANVGALRFESLPRLKRLGFSSKVGSLNEEFTAIQLVVWDTAIESLEDVIYDRIETVQIIQNDNLVNVTLPVKNITGVFAVRDNGEGTKVNLPYLGSAGSVGLGNLVAEVNLPSLTWVETVVEISSGSLKTIEFPNLVNIGKEKTSTNTNTRRATLEISRSRNLTDVSFPKLEWIMSDLRINGSEKWTDLKGFPVLGSVGRDVVINGSFTNIDLPELRAGDQGSTFWINSPQVDCTNLMQQSTFTEGNWKTNITCNGRMFDLSPEGPVTEDKKSLSGGAIAGIVVGVIAAIVAALIVVFVCFRRKGYTHTLPWNRDEPPKIPELEDGEGSTRKRKIVELGAGTSGQRAAELDGLKTRVDPELEGSIPLAELEGASRANRAPEHQVSDTKPPESDQR
ncbi:hypothetical protein TWF569_000104 [Orbilia oligospora]|uniref:Receptor L-domain domain-containing protein n=1 Tax=Orbilia oligospora TaxID=2813651 RepID=A0A7C8NTP5_ORBOL|nr:hypothetical protein TWF102_003089 [Orbilia oligospora]KAF3109410.1 hypothetical protein TWF103_005276 [Orbilia oligospora]KAF3157531.1 hypothetical protein TWF569_000104 [Orbilia oligospora]